MADESIVENSKSLNDYIESPADRTYRLEQQLKKVPRRETMSRERKHFLFINPGSEKLNLLSFALRRGTALPTWCQQGTFATKFELRNNKLYFEGLPVADDERKRKLVKECYFDPTKPSTIEAIHLRLKEEFANVSKRNVRNILNTLETYQLKKGRRRPPKVLGKMNMSGPGIIAADLFFPAKADWDSSPCLTICDCWSRFCRVFVLERKTKKMMIPCFEKFFKEMMSLGHKPKTFLSDKGSEFIGLKTSELFKKWKISVFHSPTGRLS